MSRERLNQYDYIAYIDEAGDDGLTRIKPIDTKGSSEWLVLSGVVIRAARESEVVDWVEDIRSGLWRLQSRALHFSKLSPNKKVYVCESLATLNARYFVVASNKKNMRQYKNPFAEQIPSRNWFYCWMTRLLLERITEFVAWRSDRDFGEPRKLRIEYSLRGGLSYAQMQAYYDWLKMKSTALRNFLPLGDLKWQVMAPDLLKVYPHYERAGLQLADIVASAFFKGCDKYDTGSCDPRFAKLLRPRMARFRDRPNGLISGYGLKLMPKFKHANLLPEQEEIFRFYGYPEQWWDPDPSNPLAFRPASLGASRPYGRQET